MCAAVFLAVVYIFGSTVKTIVTHDRRCTVGSCCQVPTEELNVGHATDPFWLLLFRLDRLARRRSVTFCWCWWFQWFLTFHTDQLSLLRLPRLVNEYLLNVTLLCSLTHPASCEASVHSSPHLLLQRRNQRARRHHFHQRPEDLIGQRRQRRHQEGQQAERSCAKGKRGPDPHGRSGRD